MSITNGDPPAHGRSGYGRRPDILSQSAVHREFERTGDERKPRRRGTPASPLTPGTGAYAEEARDGVPGAVGGNELIRSRNAAKSLTRGKGSSGTGTSRKRQSGSHPSPTS